MTAVTVGRRPGLLWGLSATTLALLVAGVATLWMLSTAVTPVSVSEAVARYRAAGEARHSSSAGVAPGTEAVAAAPTAGPAGVGAIGAAAAPGTVSASGAPRSAGASPVSTAAPVLAHSSGDPSAPTAGLGAARSTTPSAAPGVYSYDTSGGERVSALGGSPHTYPAHTTMTVTPSACGVDVRWDALQQRYDEWQLCAAGHGLALRTSTTYHEFYGQADKRVYSCTPETRFLPDTATAGATFGGSCQANGAAALLRGTVIGVEQVMVGPRAVATVHVHLDEQLTGATRGTRTTDSWYAIADNLLVRRNSATEADTQTSFGATHYTEKLQVQLADLRPAN